MTARRGKNCLVPNAINAHGNAKKKWFRCKADRNITLELMYTIHRRTGIVVPIGIPICRSCRRKFDLKEILHKNEEEKVIENELNSTSTVNSDDDDDGLYGQHNEPMFIEDYEERTVLGKRVRKENKIDEDFMDLGYEEQTVLGKRVRKESKIDEDFTDWSSFLDSQESLPNEVTCTQSSKSSYSADTRMKTLNEFLNLSGCSPVKSLRISILDASDRTRRCYVQKAKECVSLLFDTICPGEGEILQSLCDEKRREKSPSDLNNSLTSALVESYLNLGSKEEAPICKVIERISLVR